MFNCFKYLIFLNQFEPNRKFALFLDNFENLFQTFGYDFDHNMFELEFFSFVRIFETSDSRTNFETTMH